MTEYDDVETLGMKANGQARRVLDNLIDKWDHTKENYLDYEDAITREANRGLCLLHSIIFSLLVRAEI